MKERERGKCKDSSLIASGKRQVLHHQFFNTHNRQLQGQDQDQRHGIKYTKTRSRLLYGILLYICT